MGEDEDRCVNVVTGLLSIATGIPIIVWPSPGLLAVPSSSGRGSS
jgi:hypothetical protein